MKIMIINGPNLNLLGKREPEVYGDSSFEDYLKELREKFPNEEIDYFQSNVEGEIIDKLQEAGFSYDGIILNAASYTHTSIGIGDFESIRLGQQVDVPDGYKPIAVGGGLD